MVVKASSGILLKYGAIWGKYSENIVLYGANAMHSTGFEEQSVTSEEIVTYLEKSVTYLEPAISNLKYWEQLQNINRLSLKRRLERYRILNTWKTLEGLVPNCGVSVSQESRRNGRKCHIPGINKKAKESVKTLKEQIFQVF